MSADRGTNIRYYRNSVVDEDINNCMITGPVMEETGKHTISMKLGKAMRDAEERSSILCGVVRDGVACNKFYGHPAGQLHC